MIVADCERCIHKPKTEFLQVPELERAEKIIIRLIQESSFPEYKMIKENKWITKGQLLPLSPFFYEDDLMRVWGRLRLFCPKNMKRLRR